MIKLLTKLSTSMYYQVNNFLPDLLPGIIPRNCELCSSKITGYNSRNICYYCNKSLQRLNAICEQCSWPIYKNINGSSKCELCIVNPEGEYSELYNNLIRSNIKIALPYTHPIDKLIAKFKYNRELSKGRLLADILLEQILSDSRLILPEVIIPIPIHKNKLKQRGFNQSVELGKYLAKNLDIKLDTDLIAKYRMTDAQMSQNKLSRANNISNSFCFNKRPKYQSVALLDDVVTTGNTILTVAKLLYDANICNITIWAIARRY